MFIHDSRRSYRTYTYSTEHILVLQILYEAYSRISNTEVPVGTVEHFAGTKVPVGTTGHIHYTEVPVGTTEQIPYTEILVGTTGLILILRIREYS